jgi:hypothetical protein
MLSVYYMSVQTHADRGGTKCAHGSIEHVYLAAVTAVRRGPDSANKRRELNGIDMF